MNTAAHRHDQALRTAVVLINLGTPDAPTKSALKKYLGEFLGDPRVVDIPRAVWLPILHGIILTTRPAKSAAKYASIWTPDGSPLAVHTQRLTKLVKGTLGEAGNRPLVAYAMRYGSPAIPDVLERLAAEGASRILLVPLYPQYAASTTATAIDAAFAHWQGCRNQPEIRTIRSFCDDAGYIEACANAIRESWARNGRGDRLLLSFHGLPKAVLDRGDPYYCECQKTGRLIASSLGLAEDQYQISFQSRFGRAEWLQPYTAATLHDWGQRKIGQVDVFCPGFVADCLETLEEIAIEGKAEFLSAGGGRFQYVPCLNERPDWTAALTQIITRHLAGWPDGTEESPDVLATRTVRARALGAVA